MASLGQENYIARILNLNEEDREAYQEEVNDFFGDRTLEEEGCDSDELEGKFAKDLMTETQFSRGFPG